MKEFKYKINGSPYRVVVNKSDEEIVELEVNGTPFTVELVPKTKKPKTVVQRHTTEPAQTASATLVTRPSSPSGKNTIQSPLPGVILDIRCNVGDTVKKGQTLMILEAMKMENNILADG
ncbi:MAG: biotin/lipoyl-binding protein, partial [Fermentimonas sp.]|nr:biotin/lipoyl-binding protein [Fermentimonas sp.]